MKHTELPWTQDFSNVRANGTSVDSVLVAECDTDWTTSGEEHLANAAYIVKACNLHPRLVEALIECSVIVALTAGSSGNEAVRKARALLAEAEAE